VRLDLSYNLFWLSLGISAAAVALFLWLMRRPGKPQERQLSPPHPDPLPEGEGKESNTPLPSGEGSG
jgi:hypothetical protein